VAVAEHIRAAGFQRLCLPVLHIKFLFFVLFVLFLTLGDSQLHSYVATLYEYDP